MRIFLTGGTGYLGSVILERLLAAGHDVDALARSAAGAERLAEAGAGVVRGSLDDLDVLRAEATAADAVVHAAFEASMSEEAAATELAAVSALVSGAGASENDKPVLYTSTGLVYGIDPGQARDEDAHLPARSAQPVKAQAERVVLDAANITPIVIRAALVHGRAGSGLVTGLIGAAATTGAAAYVGDGTQSWDAIHVDDLADLYVAALERPAAGVFNARGEHRFTMRELAEAIGAVTGAGAASLPRESAAETLGPLALVLGAPGTLACDRARKTFRWRPLEGSILDDIRTGSYAGAVAAAAGKGA